MLPDSQNSLIVRPTFPSGESAGALSKLARLSELALCCCVLTSYKSQRVLMQYTPASYSLFDRLSNPVNLEMDFMRLVIFAFGLVGAAETVKCPTA